MRGKLNMELDTFKLKPKFTIVLKQLRFSIGISIIYTFIEWLKLDT